MSRQALLWQLVFDAVVLLALLILAWTGRRGASSKAAEKKSFFRRRPRPVSAVLPQGSGPMPSSQLEDLVGAAEQREEMLAEAALRQRLDRFRTRAAG